MKNINKAIEIVKELPSVKIGLDDFYGKQTVLKAINEALNMHIVSRSNAIDYKKGFELAMDFINKHPADPDITDEQVKAWIKLQDFVKKHIEK